MTFRVDITCIKKKQILPCLANQLTLAVPFLGCVALLVCKLCDLDCVQKSTSLGACALFLILYIILSKPLTEFDAKHIMQAVMKYSIFPTQEGIIVGESTLIYCGYSQLDSSSPLEQHCSARKC